MWLSKKDLAAEAVCVYKRAMKMVNKTRRDEVEVVQLCKGGCRDIPGLGSFLRATETRWLESGRDDRACGPCASGFFLVFLVAMLSTMDATDKMRGKRTGTWSI